MTIRKFTEHNLQCNKYIFVVCTCRQYNGTCFSVSFNIDRRKQLEQDVLVIFKRARTTNSKINPVDLSKNENGCVGLKE